MTTRQIVRSIKNVANRYTRAQVKVRNATSNDPWGPSGSEMAEIAQLTYSSDSFFDVMDMLSRRLNDSGKNWRHVLKALLLLDYCLHVGSENVVRWCKHNEYEIATLREFAFIDFEDKDVGLSVRSKAKEITRLLKDEDMLREERDSRAHMRDKLAHAAYDWHGVDFGWRASPPRVRGADGDYYSSRDVEASLRDDKDEQDRNWRSRELAQYERQLGRPRASTVPSRRPGDSERVELLRDSLEQRAMAKKDAQEEQRLRRRRAESAASAVSQQQRQNLIDLGNDAFWDMEGVQPTVIKGPTGSAQQQQQVPGMLQPHPTEFQIQQPTGMLQQQSTAFQTQQPTGFIQQQQQQQQKQTGMPLQVQQSGMRLEMQQPPQQPVSHNPFQAMSSSGYAGYQPMYTTGLPYQQPQMSGFNQGYIHM
ncbi:Epsin-1 [Limtongia smithiae]|uniref:Epsin-1 n=1 Tax=Limtongia smithiae TaxID=1125753 RepID=UPI0034CF9FBF